MKNIRSSILFLKKKVKKQLYKLKDDKFTDSSSYWKTRYNFGGNSGPGSYNQLAEFKAQTINTFVQENNINRVIEFGSGDGNQLLLANYKNYLGIDISPDAISLCNEKFRNDTSKSFKLLEDYNNEQAELVLSLDVIFHLVENEVFEQYMVQLFKSSKKFVIIYSSNTDKNTIEFKHVKHRNFSKWIEEYKSNWQLYKYIPNKYPFNGDAKSSSFADFYIYELKNGEQN